MQINLRNVIMEKIRECVVRHRHRCYPQEEPVIYVNYHTFYFIEVLMTDGIKYYSNNKNGLCLIATFEGTKIEIDNNLEDYEIDIRKEN